jgi:hypothetical protein
MSSEILTGKFYSPWPKFGTNLNFQWGEIRENHASTKSIVRGSYQDVELGADSVNAERVLAGLAHGEFGFKNRYRTFYDKDNDQWCIQYNNGTVDSPDWLDYLCIDDNDGMVTVSRITASSFYGLPRTGHKESASGVEWQIEHNLNYKPVFAMAFDDGDHFIIPDKIDTSGRNTTYFYFEESVTGTAIISTGGATDSTETAFPKRTTGTVNQLDGDSKNIAINSRLANLYELNPQKNFTLHSPDNRPDSPQGQVMTVVIKQPDIGFYRITWGSDYIFAGGGQPQLTQRAGGVDLFNLTIFPTMDEVLVTKALDLFY